jgi:hypothetical protein
MLSGGRCESRMGPQCLIVVPLFLDIHVVDGGRAMTPETLVRFVTDPPRLSVS